MAAQQEYKFSDIIADPAIKERWEKVRKYFFLRESTYDMTNRCNVRCEGCYYYNGEKQFAQEVKDEQAWQQLFEAEKEGVSPLSSWQGQSLAGAGTLCCCLPGHSTWGHC